MSPHSAVFRPENNGVLTKRAFCTIILSYAPRICLWFLRKKGGTPVKQIKIPAMLLALALTLTACAAGQKTFQRGSVEGRTYTSEFLGLTCTAPEEFAYLSDQEIAEMNSITLESGEDLASAMKQRLEDGGQVQDMYLMTEDALHRVGITVDKATDGKTTVDMAAFIENGIAQAEEYYAAIEGMTDVGTAAQTTKFLGGEYDSILTTFTSYVEDRTDEMMGFFSTIAASK